MIVWEVRIIMHTCKGLENVEFRRLSEDMNIFAGSFEFQKLLSKNECDITRLQAVLKKNC